MRYLQSDWKRLQEEGKKAGLLTDYQVMSALPRDEQDWDLLLIAVYPNMAALDGLDDKAEPILARVIGSEAKRNKEFIDRGAMRDILGQRLMRELLLK